MKYVESKTSFFEKIKYLEQFDYKEFNLFKVGLTGYHLKYTSRFRLKVYHKNEFTYFAYLILKWLFSKPFLPQFYSKGHQIALFDNGRFEQTNGEVSSVYLGEISNLLSSNKVKHYNLVGSTESKGVFDLEKLRSNFNIRPNFEMLSLTRSVFKILRSLESNGAFSKIEFKDIKLAFIFFIKDLSFFRVLLKNNSLKSSFLCHHFYNEALILALKEHNIVVNEVQHGIISRSKTFFFLPDDILKIKKDVLFADRIFVFADFWKKCLTKGNEYCENDIYILGRSKENLKVDLQNDKTHKTILIATQARVNQPTTNLTMELLEYAKQLSEICTQQVLVQPHPFENLVELSMHLKGTNVKVANNSLMENLKICSVFISGYSTTLFEARTMGGIKVYSLNTLSEARHIGAMVDLGVSYLLNKDNFEFSEEPQEVEEYFSDFRPNAIIQTVKSDLTN